jgi:hypothetical protein
MLDVLTYEKICECEKVIQSFNAHPTFFPVNSWISKHFQTIIGNKFENINIPEHELWKEKEYAWLFQHLKAAFPREAQFASSDSLHERIIALKKDFNNVQITDIQPMHALLDNLLEIQDLPQVQELDENGSKALLSKLYENMASNDSSNAFAISLKDKVKKQSPKTLEEFIRLYQKLFEVSHQQFLELQPLLPTNYYKNSNNNNYKKNSNHSKNRNQNPSSNNEEACYGCGRFHPGECGLKNHPDYNTENKPWLESTNGKAWSSKFNSKKEPIKVLPFTNTLSGVPFHGSKVPKRNSEQNNNNNNKIQKKT